MMCLWTDWQRARLLKRARDYEAVVVLGCESATYTVQDVLKNTDCQVLPGMQMIGTTNATLKVRFPLTIELDMHCVLKDGGVRKHKTNSD